MPQLYLFIVTTLLGGFGAMFGSILGNAFGKTGLTMGAVFGGLMLSTVAVRMALSRKWIAPAEFKFAVIGANIGFILAAVIAVRTLSSPVGPVLSATLIGAGAVIGSRMGKAPG